MTGIAMELPSAHPVVSLQELDYPHRQLRFPIGYAEGVSISYSWRGVAVPRPLTHDLFTDTLEQFGIALEVVEITGVEGRTFHAQVTLGGAPGTRTMPCRPSDALALAVRSRLPVPIMVEDSLLGEPS